MTSHYFASEWVLQHKWMKMCFTLLYYPKQLSVQQMITGIECQYWQWSLPRSVSSLLILILCTQLHSGINQLIPFIYSQHDNFGCSYFSDSSYKIKFTHDGMYQMLLYGKVVLLDCWILKERLSVVREVLKFPRCNGIPCYLCQCIGNVAFLQVNNYLCA